MSKNFKVLGLIAAVLALLYAVARVRVTDDLEGRSPAEQLAAEPSVNQERLDPGLWAPPITEAEQVPASDESLPPPRPVRDAAREPLDVDEEPARRGLERVFRVHIELSLIDFGPDFVNATADGERTVLTTGEALIFAFDSHLRTLDLDVDGLPSAALEVRRRYVHASGTFRQSQGLGLLGVREPLLTGTSHLEGAHVLFTWDASASDYKAQLIAGGSDTDLNRLDDLALDLDLGALRPPAQAGTGYSWTLPASALEGVIRPGGDLQFGYGRRPAPEGCLMAIWTYREPAIAALEGSIQATVKGREERDGRQLIAIDLAATVRSSCADGALPVELQLELTGELLWDWLADRAYAFRASGPLELVLGPTSDSAEGSMVLPVSLLFRGEATFELKTALVE